MSTILEKLLHLNKGGELLRNDYDRDKVVECMFDPVTASLIAELENGKQFCEHLAKLFSIPEDEVKERLSYLVDHGFIMKRYDGSKTFFEANKEKLSSLVEENDNFDGAIDGLTKMDSYLN